MDESRDESRDESSDDSMDINDFNELFDFSDSDDSYVVWNNKKRKKKNMIDGYTYDDMYFMDILVQIKSDYYRTKSNMKKYSDDFYHMIGTEANDFEHYQLRLNWLQIDIYELRKIISSRLAYIMGTENGLALGCLSYQDAFLIRKDILKTDIVRNNLDSMKYNYIILSMPYKLINSRIEDNVRYIQRSWRVKSKIRQKLKAAKIIQRAWISNKFNPKSKLCKKLLDNKMKNIY